ncbi:MAG: tetratricopeptide repeat protein [Cyanobacteria bacterium P01_G01_bin.38]
MPSLEIVNDSADPNATSALKPIPASKQWGTATNQSVLSKLSEADKRRLLRRRVHRDARRGNYQSAIRILSYLIHRDPDRADYYNNRGLMYQYSQQWSQALADFNQALSQQPTADRIYNNRANCYAAQQDWLRAIDDYDRAIDLNPFNMRARINQAITFRDMGQYEDALDCLDIAMFFGPPSAKLYAERGRTYHLHDHWNCAMGDYQRSLDALDTDTQRPHDNPKVLKKRIYYWMQSLLAIDE